MMADWEWTTLKSIISGYFDGPHATPKLSDEGPVFLGIKNVTNDGRLDLSEIRHISEDEFPKWTKRVIPTQGDIVLSYEATLHRYALIPKGFRGCLGRRMALLRIDENKAHNYFFFKYMLSPLWRAEIERNILTGATVDRIPIANLPNFKIKLPLISTQRKISAILSAYDDLIENNLKRIKLLEEKAQLTYEEWFVRLKFPGHETTPINPETGLPEGWEYKRLEEVAKINANSLKKDFNEKIEYIDIASVSPGNINSTTEYDFKDAPGRAKRIVKHGDIIWSCVRPNRKSYAYIWNPVKNLIASTGFCVISPKLLPTSFLLQSLTTDAFVGYLNNRSGGAAYPAVKAIDFKKSLVLCPSTELREKYDDLSKNILQAKWNYQLQNQLLKEARDILLPRLMTGMIDVDKLELRKKT